MHPCPHPPHLPVACSLRDQCLQSTWDPLLSSALGAEPQSLGSHLPTLQAGACPVPTHPLAWPGHRCSGGPSLSPEGSVWRPQTSRPVEGAMGNLPLAPPSPYAGDARPDPTVRVCLGPQQGNEVGKPTTSRSPLPAEHLGTTSFTQTHLEGLTLWEGPPGGGRRGPGRTSAEAVGEGTG